MDSCCGRGDFIIRAIIFDYFGVLAHGYGRCDEELMAFIQKELQGKFRLAVLSNMSGGTAEEMLSEYAQLFDHVLLSGELGVAKPDERAFRVAAQRLGEFPSDCLMVDDSELNCAAATKVGMQAIQYKNIADLTQKLEKYGILTP